MTPDPITDIVARRLCNGCGVCAGAFPGSIRMVEDREEGRRPVVGPGPEGRQAARAAVALCAGAQADYRDLPRRDRVDEDWGPVLAVWEGWAADPEIRHRGSSGGGVTALMLFALDSGAVRGVSHVAADPSDPRRNVGVVSRDRAGLLRGAGSRYAQASPGETLADIRAASGSVAFVGKPCDVASVQRARRAEPDLAAKIPLTVAIFCAGAPTRAATDRLLARLEVPEEASLTDLRYRGQGWPGLMQARWRDETGAERESRAIPYAEAWGEILQAGRLWRCRICADHTGAFADISVGDPWHNPPEGETAPGRSLIVARSARGRHLIEAAIAAGVLKAEPRGRDVIDRAQPNLRATQGAVWGRRLAMRLAGMRVPHEPGLALFRHWLGLSAKARAQSVAGTVKRMFRLRLWRRVRIEASE